MNLQCSKPSEPLKVIIVNPLTPAAQLLAIKILSGIVFGERQRVHLTLVVYSNEIPVAEIFKLELEKCSYSCTYCIVVSSDMPSVSDADVFCFLTNFPNPNCIEFDKIDTDEQFDSLYLIMKIANNFKWNSQNATQDVESQSRKTNRKEDLPKRKKPIFIADGLAAIDILYSFSKDMPNNVFYCPTPLPNVARSILADYLKTQCNVINDTLVWASNDEVFHVEVEKPYILHDQPLEGSCDWEMIGKDLLKSVNLDHTQFNASWMKKEFIEKIKASAGKNPYGCIYKASEFSKALSKVWSSRGNEDGDGEVYASLGVISDATVLSALTKLIAHCKQFLQENVINQAFLRVEEESTLSVGSP